jgi:hypothetical protein
VILAKGSKPSHHKRSSLNRYKQHSTRSNRASHPVLSPRNMRGQITGQQTLCRSWRPVETRELVGTEKVFYQPGFLWG